MRKPTLRSTAGNAVGGLGLVALGVATAALIGVTVALIFAMHTSAILADEASAQRRNGHTIAEIVDAITPAPTPAPTPMPTHAPLVDAVEGNLNDGGGGVISTSMDITTVQATAGGAQVDNNATGVYIEVTSPDADALFGINAARSANGKVMVVCSSSLTRCRVLERNWAHEWTFLQTITLTGVGQRVIVNQDGSLFAVRDASENKVFIYERDAGSEWLLLDTLEPSISVTSFGNGLSATPDFSRVAIQSIETTTNVPGVHVFHRDSHATWTEELRIESPNTPQSDYGRPPSINADGDLLLIADTDVDTSAGAVYTHVRNGEEWEEVGTALETPADAYLFGDVVSQSRDSEWFAIDDLGPESSEAGALHLFRRNDSVSWVLSETINATVDGELADATYFGSSPSFDAAGERLIVNRGYNDSGDLHSKGISIYRRADASWSKLLGIEYPGDDATNSFPFSSLVLNSLTDDGDSLFAPDVNNVANDGAIYVFPLYARGVLVDGSYDGQEKLIVNSALSDVSYWIDVATNTTAMAENNQLGSIRLYRAGSTCTLLWDDADACWYVLDLQGAVLEWV